MINAIIQAVYLPIWARRSRVCIVPIVLGAGLLFSACSPDIEGMLVQASEMATYLRCLMAVIGLALMVAGFYLYEVIIELIGFITGGVAGAFLGLAIGGDGGGTLLYAVIGFVVGGLIGAMLAAFLTCLSVFLSGFIIGAVALGTMYGGLVEDFPEAAVLIIGGIIGGMIMLALYRFWVTALTSAIGSVLLGLGISAPLWVWIVFFLIGIACQYGLGKVTGNEEKVRPGYRGA